MTKPSPEMLELLLALRRRLEAVAHGEAGALMREFAGLHHVAPSTLYRWLADHVGYASGRKKRCDAGTTRLPEESLLFIASSKNIGVRQNGISTKPTGVAMNIADANGFEINVSQSRVNSLLRGRSLDVKKQAAARNHIQLRSRYPNHVHQIDPSLCLVYYLGKKQMVMTEAEFNKNKPVALEKVKLKVWRYVRYDHASGSLDVRYFEATGENQRSMFDFLLWTWGKQGNRLSHGVPKHLIWDKGSANTSTAIQRLLDALGVEHETHATHHAWVKGGVENGNRIVETHFECLLREEPVGTVEQLNAASERWVRDYNANHIKHVDCRIRRDSGEPMVRDDLWQLILRHSGALVEMPERKVCAWFLTGSVAERQVRDNKISFVHPEIGKSRTYDLSAWADSYSQKDKVRVWPVLMVGGAIRVEIERFGQEPLTAQAMPEVDFDDYGRTFSAAVIGEERRSAPHTVAENAAKELARTTWGEGVTLAGAEELARKNTRPFQHINDGRGAVAHSHLGKGDLPQRLLPAARELDTPELAAVRNTRIEFKPLNHIEAARQIRALLAQSGHGDIWSPDRFQWLAQRWPDGVPQDHLADIADELTGAKADMKQPLRSVK